MHVAGSYSPPFALAMTPRTIGYRRFALCFAIRSLALRRPHAARSFFALRPLPLFCASSCLLPTPCLYCWRRLSLLLECQDNDPTDRTIKENPGDQQSTCVV